MQTTTNGTATNGKAKRAKKADADAIVQDFTPQVGKLTIKITTPPLHVVRFAVVGDEPLIIKRFSEKSEEAIRRKKEGLHVEKETTTYEQDFQEARYIDNEGRDCVKASAFKGAIVSAASFCKNMKGTRVRKGVFVLGDLLPIESAPPVMRTDVVRNAMSGGSSVCARPEYRDWRVSLTVKFLRSEFGIEQVMNLFSYAGVCVGIGERRPEKEGANFGTFHVDPGSIVGIEM